MKSKIFNLPESIPKYPVKRYSQAEIDKLNKNLKPLDFEDNQRSLAALKLKKWYKSKNKVEDIFLKKMCVKAQHGELTLNQANAILIKLENY